MPAEATAQAIETLYYGYDWSLVKSRDHAAFAVHVTRDATGRVTARRHESFKPYPTKSTDPKTGSHH